MATISSLLLYNIPLFSKVFYLFYRNAEGRVLAESNASSDNYKWNIQNLPAGNYFLIALQGNKQIASIKFIKQ